MTTNVASSRPVRPAPQRPAPERRPRWIECVELASIVAFAAVWTAVIARLFDSVPLQRIVWILPVSLFVGFAVADFVGGAVHWFADTYFDPGTPVVGPLLIEPFRDHHRDPQGITRHGFLERTGNNALATVPLGGALLLLEAPGGGAAEQVSHASVTAMALALFATNSFHRWAHMRRPPAPARWLQRRRISIGYEAHALHHSAAHDRSYCVTSGWLNPLLDRVGFFRRLEHALAAAGIEAPRREASRSEDGRAASASSRTTAGGG